MDVPVCSSGVLVGDSSDAAAGWRVGVDESLGVGWRLDVDLRGVGVWRFGGRPRARLSGSLGGRDLGVCGRAGSLSGRGC